MTYQELQVTCIVCLSILFIIGLYVCCKQGNQFGDPPRGATRIGKDD